MSALASALYTASLFAFASVMMYSRYRAEVRENPHASERNAFLYGAAAAAAICIGALVFGLAVVLA